LLILLLQLTPPAFGQPTAKPFLHPLFTEHMVLQRDIPAPIWGWTSRGEKVTVRLSDPGMEDATASATAGADGKWMVKLGPLKPGGPYTLAVTGPQEVTLQDVLVGDVWLCSGQSNMRMGVTLIAKPEELAAATHPHLRLFTVPKITAITPRETLPAKWDLCTPKTIAEQPDHWGGFSAVAYYFGKNIQEKYNVPIGLIHSSWGGSVVEAWVGAARLRKAPEYLQIIEQLEAQAQKPDAENLPKLMETFWQADPGTVAHWEKEPAEVAQWKTMTVPGKWELAGLPDYDGVAWFRKEVTLPEDWAGKELTLHLGAIDDRETTFFNGEQVGATDDSQKAREYKIPAALVRAGRNVITVRVLDSGRGGGFRSEPSALHLDGPTSLPLAGDWTYKASLPLADAPPVPLAVAGNHNCPTALFNGMIAPLEPVGIKGALWYQGESNIERASEYGRVLPLLIEDWRATWGIGEFPFLIVQLPNMHAPRELPGDSGWATFREVQAQIARTVPNAGLAVTIDLGQADDIHPTKKQEVGRRLALVAQNVAYGETVEASGPIYASVKIEAATLRLSFQHAAGLAARGGAMLTGFAVAGDDKKWVWADAKVDGSDVVLSSPSVPQPTAARYSWADNPSGNLTNATGLPAMPFRTDAP
jgi:sialate O-acetylesterase